MTVFFVVYFQQYTDQERSQARDADDGCPISNANGVSEILRLRSGVLPSMFIAPLTASGKERADKISSTSSPGQSNMAAA